MVSISLHDVVIALGGRLVIKGISAQLDAGSLVGIVGPNGAGKSTLVRAMTGLIPIASGNIDFDNHPVASLPRQQIAKCLAYLPQGQTLHWPLTVERLVALGRLPHLAPLSKISAADQVIVEESMRRADVLDLRHRNATHISGGERARVMLARALAVDAASLIVDEPLASLDPGHQIDVMTLLANEAKEGSLVVAVLHDLVMAARYCDRLMLIDDGCLIADGRPENVLTPQNLAEVYGVTAHFNYETSPPLIVPISRSMSK